MSRPDVPEHVWVGEAYQDGERVDFVVHLNEGDAREDIETLTDAEDVTIQVHREKLYTGRESIEA